MKCERKKEEQKMEEGAKGEMKEERRDEGVAAITGRQEGGKAAGNEWKDKGKARQKEE